MPALPRALPGSFAIKAAYSSGTLESIAKTNISSPKPMATNASPALTGGSKTV